MVQYHKGYYYWISENSRYIMDIDTAQKLSFDILKSEYREYLKQQQFSKNTILTASNDAFYLWKNESKELFWKEMLSLEFEKTYKVAILNALNKYSNSKGNIQKLVAPYVSSARRFRKFLGYDINNIGVIKEHDNEKNVVIPAPCISEVDKYLKQWNELEHYHLQENALDKLFLKLCPNNTDISDILIKVSTLNDFYSTNIYSVYPVAKHILQLNVDARMKAGDVTLINDIQKVKIGGVERKLYSFATKYCSHHNPLEYPIYDNYVEKVLKYFRDLDRFSIFENNDLKDYIHFKGVLVDFRKFYQLEKFNLKEIDKYIWQLGKEYFPKNYKKSK